MHEYNFLTDPVVWYAVALILFLTLVVRMAGKPIVAMLDAEIAKIRNNLEEAKRLRKEAEDFLVESRAKHKAAMADADEILKVAREEMARMKAKAEEDLKTTLDRQEQRALDRIRMAEVNAMTEVRQAVIDAAMAEARQALAKIDSQTAGRLIDDAVAEIPRLKVVQK